MNKPCITLFVLFVLWVSVVFVFRHSTIVASNQDVILKRLDKIENQLDEPMRTHCQARTQIKIIPDMRHAGGEL